MKDDDYVFSIRELDRSGVSDASKLETNSLEEAILTARDLLSDPYKKWVIVATSLQDDEDED